MNGLLLKSIFTQKLKKNEILNICKLKDTQWKYGVKSQLKWFSKNIQEHDIHNLAYFKKKLVGYGLLRKRNFLLKKKKYTYLYYDTLIVSKKYRKLKIGDKISNLTIKIIKKIKLHSMLICEKKIVPFHERYKWKKIDKNKSQILDHKYSKNFSIMCFNRTEKIKKNSIKYFIFS